MMDSLPSSEMSVDVYQTTRWYIPEDKTLHRYRCERLESNNEGKGLQKNLQHLF
jgi:hypothetical protein